MQREKDTGSILIYFNHLADARFHCSKRRLYLILQCMYILNLVVLCVLRSLPLQEWWAATWLVEVFPLEAEVDC